MKAGMVMDRINIEYEISERIRYSLIDRETRPDYKECPTWVTLEYKLKIPSYTLYCVDTILENDEIF